MYLFQQQRLEIVKDRWTLGGQWLASLASLPGEQFQGSEGNQSKNKNSKPQATCICCSTDNRKETEAAEAPSVGEWRVEAWYTHTQ